jgi:ankyrin repeat protein
MKAILCLLALLVSLTGERSVFAAEETPSKPAPSISKLEQTFRDGLYAEEAKQDLNAAAKAYQDVVAAFDQDRETVASALFRLGEVHRKQSRPDAARDCFRRIAREFSDREKLARLARENLKALGETLPEVPAAATPGPASADPEQDKALARLKELEKSSPDILLDPGTSLKTNGGISYDEALQAGYLRVVQWLVEHGASPSQTPAGNCPLNIAAEYSHAPLVEWLISKGAPVEGMEGKPTPLFAAATRGHRAIVALLLDKGAAIDGKALTAEEKATEQDGGAADAKWVERWRGGWTGEVPPGPPDNTLPLATAVERGHKAVVELLLERGANPGAKRGRALFAAISKGRTDLLKLLLDRGADPNKAFLRMLRLRPPQAATAQTGRRRVVLVSPPELTTAPEDVPGFGRVQTIPKYYLGYAQRDANRADVFTPLHLAAAGENSEIAALLIASGANVHAKSPAGSTALELACLTDRLENGQLLVKAGAKADLMIPGDYRLVDLALCRQSIPWYDLFRKAGAVVSGDFRPGLAPLDILAWQGIGGSYRELFRRLVEEGADPNSYSAVVNAARLRDVGLINLLKSHGADFSQNGHGGHAVRYAVAAALFPGKQEGTPEFTANDALVVKALIDGGANLNDSSELGTGDRPANFINGRTALGLMAQVLPSLESLERFLAFGPDPYIAAKSGYFPLSAALEEYAAKGSDENPRIKANGPAVIRRLWEYEKIEHNKNPGKRVWLQSVAVDRPNGGMFFLRAAPEGASATAAEVIKKVFVDQSGGGLKAKPPETRPDLLPTLDLRKCTILRCDAANGKILKREPLDLLALAEKGDAAGMPVLRPGDVLEVTPTPEGSQATFGWKSFPKPAPELLEKLLPAPANPPVKSP